MSRIENMTMGELLRQKKADYGYRSIDEMAADIGISSNHLFEMMHDRRKPGKRSMRKIVQGLDVSPEVAERMVRRR